MSARIIDGKAIAATIKARVAEEVAGMKARGRSPCLAAILIGDDPAAASYARSQEKHAGEVGIDYRLIRLPASATQADAAEAIRRLGADAGVSGIMLHMPVPRSMDGFALQQLIDPAKDVEGVGATNLGLLAMDRDALAPCTAAAAMECLRSVLPDLKGRDAVVVGRSVIVGKPLAMLLLAANATVTQCHTRTRQLPDHTRSAEVLMVAAGVAGLIGPEHVAPGTVVVDVGTHRVTLIDAAGREVSRTVGDVRFDEVGHLASAISPVPGGVGPVTVAKLLENTLKACRRQVG